MRAASIFATSTCALCGINPGDLCVNCRRELPWIEAGCARCGIPLPYAAICGRCLRRPPVFSRCISPLGYEAPVSHLISAFKYRHNFHYGRILSDQLAARLYREAELGADCLVPVPLHWRRRWTRGFNQAEIIADELSRALRLPLDTHSLRRSRAAAPQQSLNAVARRRNLRGAFTCDDGLRGRHIALIDDVVTTATTAGEIARTLLAAGAASVQVWCLARTP